MEIKIKKLNKNAILPKYMTDKSAGMDIFACIDNSIVLKPLQRVLIPTGLSIALPDGYEAQIRPRSGLAYKHGVTLLNTPGTIDADYRGEIKIILINFGNEEFQINHGDRIAQMIISKIEKPIIKIAQNLDDTERGKGGFGSTGIS
jgi:dUTP pyrophosphatase